MPYFAAVLARSGSDWTGQELELDEADDVYAVADLMREVDDTAQTTLLFVEEDDEYLAVVRVDGAEDPRVFVSDARAAETFGLAALLLAEVDLPVPPDPDEDADERESTRPDIEPAGDATLLSDLGTDSGTLLKLCAHEGMLPADVITALCERAGCVEQLEELRES